MPPYRSTAQAPVSSTGQALRLHAPPPPGLYAAADAATPALRALWLQLLRRFRRAIPRAALRDALARGDRFGAEALLGVAQGAAFGRQASRQVRAVLAPVFTLTTAMVEDMLPAAAARPLPVAGGQSGADTLALVVQEQVNQMTTTTRLALWTLLRQVVAPPSLLGMAALLPTVPPPAWLVVEVAGLTTRQVETIVRGQAAWAAEGRTLVAQRIRVRQAVQLALLTRSEAAARYQVILVANIAREAVWRTAVQDGTLDAQRWEREWVAQPGACALCDALDGERRPFGAAFGGGVAYPPAHVRCLTGDTLITAGGDVTATSKRWYDGEVVILRTARGKQLTCTPNHPILTAHGWRAATNIFGNFTTLMGALIADGKNGPYHLYLHPDQYIQTMALQANTAVTLLSMIESIKGMGPGSVSSSSNVTAGTAVLVQMSSDVVDLAIGQEIVPVEWETKGGLVTRWKVLGAMVPRVKAHSDGRSGLATMAGI